eukprot:6201365-Pleurochrysis_carterae.AAC.3
MQLEAASLLLSHNSAGQLQARIQWKRRSRALSIHTHSLNMPIANDFAASHDRTLQKDKLAHCCESIFIAAAGSNYFALRRLQASWRMMLARTLFIRAVRASRELQRHARAHLAKVLVNSLRREGAATILQESARAHKHTRAMSIILAAIEGLLKFI